MSECDELAEKIIDDSRKGICGGCGATIHERVLAHNIATALRAEREKVAAKFAAFAGPDGEPKSVKWPAVAGVSDRDELWEKYICRDDEDAHAVLSLIAFIDYRLQAAAEAAKEKK